MALALELAHRLEELIHLLGDEHGGGLVQNQDLCPAIEDFDDLDPLSLTDRQFLHLPVGIEFEPVVGSQLADPLRGAVEVDHDPGPGLGAEDHVLQDGEVVGQHEMLVDHPDPGINGILGSLEVGRLTVDGDGALVGTDHPVDDLHEGGLAGPVLPDDGMDVTESDGQLDILVGHYPRIPLGDALELYCGCLSHLPIQLDAAQIERRAQVAGPGAS